jgi:formylglycine-generating enzyme required for sulfatase activity
MTKKNLAQKSSQVVLRAALPPNRLAIIVILALVVAGLGLRKYASCRSVQANRLVEIANTEASPAAAANGFAPTVENKNPPTGSAPAGMAWIPGGEFSMGAQDPPTNDAVGMQATVDSRPIHRVYVDGFWMDKTDVTNAEFAKFVKATGYVTVAERKPRAEDYPGAPPENLVAGSVVFSPPDHPVGFGRSLSMVVVRSRCGLAASLRSPQQHPGKVGLSGRAGSVRRCCGFCEMGWETIADRGRVGIRGAGRPHGQTVCLGR